MRPISFLLLILPRGAKRRGGGGPSAASIASEGWWWGRRRRGLLQRWCKLIGRRPFHHLASQDGPPSPLRGEGNSRFAAARHITSASASPLRRTPCRRPRGPACAWPHRCRRSAALSSSPPARRPAG